MAGNFAPVRRGLMRLGADKALVDALETWVKANSVGPDELTPIATDTLMGRDTAGTGNVEAITVGGGLEFTSAGGIRRSALTGDVTAPAGSGVTTLASTAVTPATYGDATHVGQFTVDAKGRITAASNVPITASGTVTSIALTVPSFLSVSGGPITTSGTLAVALQTQSANLIFGGPSTGSAATPTFRSLVAADLPNTAVTPGAYTSANITVDAQGRITLAANGSGGGGTPGGSSGQIQYNNAGAFGGFTASGDATINTGTGAVAVTKTGGVSFGYFATGTDASNLTGNLSVSRFDSGTGASVAAYWRGDGTWATRGPWPFRTVAGTTDTLIAADESAIVRTTNASPVTITVPDNATVPFPLGCVITVRQSGDGPVTIALAVGVTMNPRLGGSYDLDGRGDFTQLVKVGTDDWDMF